jgi:rod shape-determining protein MreD
MRDGIGQALPTLLAIVAGLILMGATPLISPQMALPHLAALMVVFWALYRPSALPCGIVLLLGLMLDVLYGQPLGLEATMLLALRVVTEWRFRIWAERPFPLQWLLVGLMLALAFILKNWVQEAYTAQPVSWSRTGMSWFFSILCYPLVHMLCSWVFTVLPRNAGGHGTPPIGRGMGNRHEGRR